MGWENRGNKKYYYRKRRVGEKVVSEYIGAGPEAERIAREDQLERQKLKRHRQVRERRRAEFSALDDQLDLLDRSIRTLINAHLLLAGYHTQLVSLSMV
jgi:hypothetical protein